jgi:hypothetical protein
MLGLLVKIRAPPQISAPVSQNSYLPRRVHAGAKTSVPLPSRTRRFR